MSLFGNNQVCHMYVANELSTEANGVDFRDNSAIGDVMLIGGNGNHTVTPTSELLRFIYKNASERVSLSPVINKKKIKSARLRAPKLQSFKNIVISNLPTAGAGNVNAGTMVQVKIWLKEWYSVSPENQYFQFGEYVIGAGDTATDVANGLAISLAKNLSTQSTDITSESTFTVPASKGGGTNTIVDNPYFTVTVNVDDLVLTEKEQIYVRGKIKPKSLNFTVQISELNASIVPPTITESYVDSTGAVSDYYGLGFGNPNVIADMEWFYLGNRGDTYRQIGYPNNFDTKYISKPKFNPVLTDYYTTLSIEFWNDGDAEDVQKSPIEVIIVSNKPTVITGLATVLTTVGVTVVTN